MLFTRCPGCQTTFRISVDTLRVAHGAVRCGNCATVFSAFTGLRQDALEEGPLENDALLSPTLQTQELAGIEEIAGPRIDETGIDETESPIDDAEPSEADDPQPADVEAGDAGDAAQEQPAPADEPDIGVPTPIDAAATTTDDEGDAPPQTPAYDEPMDETENRDAPVAAERSSAKLYFEPPVDEWALLLSEIERSVDERSVRIEDQARDLRDAETRSTPAMSPAPDTDETPELWNIGEPFSLDAYDDTAERRKLGTLDPRGEEARESVDLDDGDAEHAAGFDEAISAEEIDATLSADPDPAIVAVLEAGLDQTWSEPPRTRRWALGSLALIVALGIQVVHHFRAPLATQPGIGAALQGLYGLLGLELIPEWDLEQYEITNWAATAGTAGGGPGNLHITAQIRNRGPSAQPYPNILLELKDRWEAVIGSRVFAPSEYLAASSQTSDLMAAGSTAPADLTVVDPGLDASGFELDVCLEMDTGRMSCSSDRVFE